MKRTHIIGRLAYLSLFAVLLALAGFSIWAAALNQQATSDVESSTAINNLFRQVNSTLSTEIALQNEYALEPSVTVKNEHLAAANTLIALLQRLQQEGDPEDASLARQALAAQTHYLLITGQFFAAVDAHDLTRARAIHSRDIDPEFDQFQQHIQTEADKEKALAADSVKRLVQVQRMTFTITPLVFAIGLLLMGVSGWITRTYRRKLDEAVQSEMAHLARLALTDPLTGLGNHHAYQERLSQALEKARRDESALALALLDIDDFKVFNDERGHQCGDEALLAFATVLREAHLSESLFRLGGDDFALLVPQTALADAALALERFREDVARRPLGVTVSIGMANTTSERLTGELLHAQAFAALQEAKRRGRNRMLTFEEVKGNVSIVSSTKIQALRRLLGEGKIAIAFQPIWNLATGTVLAFEALTRPAAEYGFSGPQEMFDIAEQIGRAHELDAICVRAILSRAAELPPEALLFLNLTPQTLVHDLLTGATLLEAVVTARLEPSRVVLEITERSIVEITEVVQKVKFLRLMGFQVALDDAGAGNAGLEMLSRLPVDFVKIDRAVVGRALTDQAAYSVLAGIVTISRESHLSVVAEGIENPEMLDLVQQLHVQCAQGYLLGRPSETIPGVSDLQDLSSLLYASSH